MQTRIFIATAKYNESCDAWFDAGVYSGDIRQTVSIPPLTAARPAAARAAFYLGAGCALAAASGFVAASAIAVSSDFL